MVCYGPRSALCSWAISFMVLILAGPHVATAQEPPTFELPEIVVPGKRPQSGGTSPASVTVITQEMMQQWGVRTVADALRMVPELSVRAYGGPGGLAEPSVRGSTPGQVLVLLDGIPLNNVALGQTDLSTISMDAVDRVELLRGPFAAIYGSGALGGVINIITSRAARGRAMAHSGGWGQRSAALRFGAFAPLTVTVDATSGHRTNSDYTGMTLATHVDLSADSDLLIHYYSADLGTPGDAAAPTPNDRQAERRLMTQLTLGPDDRSEPWGRLYYVSDRLSFIAPGGTSVYDSTVVGGELQRVWQRGPERLVTAGIEMQAQHLDALVFGSAIAADILIGAGYAQYDTAVSTRLLVSAGLRLDAHSTYGATLNPRAGVLYRWSDTTQVRAAVGRTFRGPTFLHLFFPGCSNPGLMPESAWSAEVGVEHRWSRAGMSATGFATEAEDLITGGCPPQNVGAASIRGLSLEVKGSPATRLTVSVNATAMQAVDRTTGNPLPRVPGFSAGVSGEYQLAPAAAVVLLANYVGPRTDFDFSTLPASLVSMPGYVDVRLRYRWLTAGGWTVAVGVDNVFDGAYEPVKGYPAPGRSISVTATKEF